MYLFRLVALLLPLSGVHGQSFGGSGGLADLISQYVNGQLPKPTGGPADFFGQLPKSPGGLNPTGLPGPANPTAVAPSPNAPKVPTKPTPDVGPGSGGGVSTPLQTTFPKPNGNVNLNAAKQVTGSFDGGMKMYDRSPSTCKGQNEGGDKDAIFIVQNGGTLSNVIIGPNNGEGVHCMGTCTLNNVWWSKVCEDAATFKQKSGTSYVNGGGARQASDKVFQHNGGGTVHIKNFFAEKIGKLYRSCGNCKTQSARTVIMENVHVHGGKVAAGINGNLGDKATIRNSCIKGADICWLFKGVTGGEPSKTGSKPDGRACTTAGMMESC